MARDLISRASAVVLLLGLTGACSASGLDSDDPDDLVTEWAQIVCRNGETTSTEPKNETESERLSATYCTDGSVDDENNGAALLIYKRSVSVEALIEDLPCEDFTLYGRRWITFPIEAKSRVAEDLVDRGARSCLD